MQTLFSSSRKKDNVAESVAEADRARIQAVIDRALLMPEVEVLEGFAAAPVAAMESEQFSTLELNQTSAVDAEQPALELQQVSMLTGKTFSALEYEQLSALSVESFPALKAEPFCAPESEPLSALDVKQFILREELNENAA